MEPKNVDLPVPNVTLGAFMGILKEQSEADKRNLQMALENGQRLEHFCRGFIKTQQFLRATEKVAQIARDMGYW